MDGKSDFDKGKIYGSLSLNVDRLICYFFFMLFMCESMGWRFRPVYVLTLLLANWSWELFNRRK